MIGEPSNAWGGAFGNKGKDKGKHHRRLLAS